ncbi:MOSC domain-containing protein [Geodermatophilus sp. SYSU D01176]
MTPLAACSPCPSAGPGRSPGADGRSRPRAERTRLPAGGGWAGSDGEGDAQAGLVSHGGEHRAVIAYQRDSYVHRERHLGRRLPEHGTFREDFTVEGLADDEVCIGDRLPIGGAVLEVTQP